MHTIAVVDYGMGNLRSVSKALEHVAPAARVVVSADPQEIGAAERVVVPGQGAARECMAALRAGGLIEPIRAALATRPFLGICMGLQVLLETSDENDGVECLGWCSGAVRAFAAQAAAAPGHKIPHMGWNQVYQSRAHPLFEGIADGARFYFVHSYYVDPGEPALIAASTDYGLRFTSALARANVFACQFHPEKSAVDGLRLLRNFAHWDGAC